MQWVAHLHESVSVNGHKALRAVGAHLSVLGPVRCNHSLEDLCSLLEGDEEGSIPAFDLQKLMEAIPDMP